MKARYIVKEIFGPTLQGEGAYAGTPCVFLRFAGCNLACIWCDTDFSKDGAEKLTAEQIVDRLKAVDLHGSNRVVVTGGEPALQWDEPLALAIKTAGYTAHMETNGTRRLRARVDWLTVSPKSQFHEGDDRLVDLGQPISECKLVVDRGVDEQRIASLATRYPQAQLFLQPCMDDDYDQHLRRTMELCQQNPSWRLSLQLHKILNIP